MIKQITGSHGCVHELKMFFSSDCSRCKLNQLLLSQSYSIRVITETNDKMITKHGRRFAN